MDRVDLIWISGTSRQGKQRHDYQISPVIGPQKYSTMDIYLIYAKINSIEKTLTYSTIEIQIQCGFKFDFMPVLCGV